MHKAFQRVCRAFLMSAALMLIWTAGFKLATIVVDDPRLRQLDPVLTLTVREVLLAAALLETVVAAYVLQTRCPAKRAIILLGFSGSLLLYRFLLWQIDPQARCNCLGFGFPWLRLPEIALDRLAFVLLAYFIAGSLLVLAVGSLCGCGDRRVSV